LKFNIKKFNNHDIEAFVNLSKSYYSSKNVVSNKKNVRWKHLKSPYGPSYIYKMTDNKDNIMGRIMFNQNILISGNKKIKTINPSDLLINKKYKTSPLSFINLINGPKNFLKNRYTIHTANENSINLYKNLLKFPIYFSIKSYCFPLNPLSIFFKNSFFKLIINFLWRVILFFVMPLTSSCNLKFIKKDLNSNEINKLKNNIRSKKIPFFDRSKQFYDWRNEIYKKEKILTTKIYKKNKLVGYVYAINFTYKKVDLFLILDYLFISKFTLYESLCTQLYLIQQAILLKTDFVFLMGNPNSRIFKYIAKFPYLKVNDRFLPHPSPFFGRKENINIDNYKKFHLTLMDLDYF
jgi:hypothetical protein